MKIRTTFDCICRRGGGLFVGFKFQFVCYIAMSGEDKEFSAAPTWSMRSLSIGLLFWRFNIYVYIPKPKQLPDL